ncbi:hypothetical protein P5V15_014105 [Pogonomyrmex californicus]
MKRLQIKIMGISELKWHTGTCSLEEGGLVLLGSHEEDRHRRNGVAVLVDSEYVKYVKNFLYETIEHMLDRLGNNAINLIIGDFNAKIEERRRVDIVGDCDLGTCNNRGDKLYVRPAK